MNIGQKIGQQFDRYTSWVLDDENDMRSFLKCVTPIVLALGALVAPFTLVAHQNNKKIQETYDHLDNSPTVIFQSVAQCEDRGYSEKDCMDSQRAALKISKGLGTAVSYSSKTKCIKIHGECNEDSITTPVPVGNNTTMFMEDSSHRPLVVGWQAATNDLGVTVPVYSGAEEGTAVRGDGLVLRLD